MKKNNPINFSFFKKTLFDLKWKTLTYSFIVILYGILIIAFFPTIKNQAGEFQTLIEAYPEGLIEAFGASSTSLQSIEGFLSVEYLSLMWVIIMAILIFSMGVSLVAGEVDKGTSSFSFTLPLKRQTVVSSKFLASFLVLIFIIFITLLSIVVMLPFVDETMNTKGLLAFFAISSCMSFFLLSFTALCSSIFSTKGKVYSVCGGFFIGSYMLHILYSISDKVENLYYFSFLKYYGNSEAILKEASVDWENILIFLISGGVLLTLTLYVTEKRDL